MTSVLRTVLGKVEEIQVAMSPAVEGKFWGEAILTHISSIVKNDAVVMSRPKIRFNNTVLQLIRGKYEAYYVTDDPDSHAPPLVAASEMLIINDPTQVEVEHGLLRFVSNNQLRQFCIDFGENGLFILTKGRDRSSLCIATSGRFPSSEDKIRQYKP